MYVINTSSCDQFPFENIPITTERSKLHVVNKKINSFSFRENEEWLSVLNKKASGKYLKIYQFMMLGFRSYWPKNKQIFFSTIEIKNQLS